MLRGADPLPFWMVDDLLTVLEDVSDFDAEAESLFGLQQLLDLLAQHPDDFLVFVSLMFKFLYCR